MRLSSSTLTAAAWGAVARIRALTLITPNQDATSGGPYVIEQLARALAPALRVNLVVDRERPSRVPGVETFFAPGLRAEDIPDADAAVLYADAADGAAFHALPERKGRRYLYFQGYGALQNPAVLANLRRGWPVVATARWLVDEARRHGCAAAFAGYGLDRAIFHCREGVPRRPTQILMMTHSIDWKGTPDGLTALGQVLRARPAAEVVLFGVHDPGFPGARFVLRPGRREVAQLLRESAIFVCPSWEEGFGMPGLEALACGAALATTDTKGSRDYAYDAETALVTPPRDPGALAASITRLLDDGALRARLTAAGRRRAARYRSWPMAAAHFVRGLALASLRSGVRA